MLRTELIQPVSELLLDRASKFPNKVAYKDQVRSVTYHELQIRTANLATQLLHLGIAHGDRIVIHLDDSVNTVESYFGITRAGAIGVCVDPKAAQSELEYMVLDSGAKTVIVDRAHYERAVYLRGRIDGLKVILTASNGLDGEAVSYDQLVSSAIDGQRHAIDTMGLDDVSWIVYTSGTTGRRKGVMLTQRGCLWDEVASWDAIARLGPDDFVLSPLPLFHSYALVLSVLGILVAGATEQIVRFSPDQIIETLRTQPITFFPGVPTMFQYLLNALGGKSLDAKSLRLCVSAGAIMPGALNESFERASGVLLLDGYGITETSTMVIMNWPDGNRKPGSCGYPLLGSSVRLVDPVTLRDVSVGEVGEVWVSGPHVMVGYYNKPEATQGALTDGWYHTGDLATRDYDGLVTICGRTKELIIRGGENIYPAEVEAVILIAPGVKDAAVIGAPHSSLGEEPVAFVVPGDDFDTEELMNICRANLSATKVPVAIYFIPEIPRTGSGKAMRYLLKEQLENMGNKVNN